MVSLMQTPSESKALWVEFKRHYDWWNMPGAFFKLCWFWYQSISWRLRSKLSQHLITVLCPKQPDVHKKSRCGRCGIWASRESADHVEQVISLPEQEQSQCAGHATLWNVTGSAQPPKGAGCGVATPITPQCAIPDRVRVAPPTNTKQPGTIDINDRMMCVHPAVWTRNKDIPRAGVANQLQKAHIPKAELTNEL